MEFTAFSEFGQFGFTAAPPLAQRIYDALWANLGDSYTKGGYTDAKVYATAMALARLGLTQQRLDAQLSPATALELLPAREVEHGLVVPYSATLAQRRAALAAQMRLGQPNDTPNILQALGDLLGADFVGYEPTPTANVVLHPTDPSTGPGNPVAPDSPKKWMRLVESVSSPDQLDNPLFGWRYSAPDGHVLTAAELFQPGEWVVVEPEHNTLRERVQIVSSQIANDNPHHALAFGVLTKPHHALASVVAGRWPYWASTRRHNVVMTTATVTDDAIAMSRLHVLLSRLMRAVSTWSVLDSEGPFLTDESPTDTTPLEQLFV